MNQKLPVLTVMRLRSEFDRYLIQDEQRLVWTGTEFGSSGAVLYSNSNEACLELHRILRSQFEGIEPKRYVVPCFVEVFSHEPVREVDVARFLSRGATLTLDTDRHGYGPENSLVLPVIDWKRIEAIKEIPQ